MASNLTQRKKGANAAANTAIAAAATTTTPSTLETVEDSSSSSYSYSTSSAVSSSFHDSEFVFQCLILFAICILAFMCRLFSVVRYESVIHEFDPCKIKRIMERDTRISDFFLI
jgi:hypothetical protein